MQNISRKQKAHIIWYRLFTIVALVSLSVPIVFSQSALTPQQVAQKAAGVISNAKGLSASFTVKGNGRTASGTIKCAGNKFSVKMPDASVWYNGKNLYTYNPRVNETTVTTPSAQELIDSNPLLYVKGGGSNYKYSFSSVKRNGKYVVDLTPISNKTGIKKLTFTINSSNYHIERIMATTSSGSVTVDISSLQVGTVPAASEFEYPKSKYPKAEIIDLR